MLKHHSEQRSEVSKSLIDRRFLLLQGPSSFFFSDLGEALRASGADVHKIGFCPGEWLYWRNTAGTYHPYRSTMKEFPTFLAGFVADHRVSDIVMLGDGRKPHAAAVAAKQQFGLTCRIWIVEHGYLRPSLILIEAEGMGGASLIPSKYDPSIRFDLEKEALVWPASFARYAALDVTYHLATVVAAPISYPHYRPHSGISPLREYAGWIGKALRGTIGAKPREMVERRIADHDGPVFLFPLQLSQDFQLTNYGTGEDQEAVLTRVVTSFQAHAPENALLIVKVHPLDNGLTRWDRLVADQRGNKPVLYLDGGDLTSLLTRAQGVVTINSTVGLAAIQSGCPTCVLGRAVYDLPGLTHETGLDQFWRLPIAPEPEMARNFVSYLRAVWHVPGAFDGPGSRAGAKALATWLGNPPNLSEVQSG